MDGLWPDAYGCYIGLLPIVRSSFDPEISIHMCYNPIDGDFFVFWRGCFDAQTITESKVAHDDVMTYIETLPVLIALCDKDSSHKGP